MPIPSTKHYPYISWKNGVVVHNLSILNEKRYYPFEILYNQTNYGEYEIYGHYNRYYCFNEKNTLYIRDLILNSIKINTHSHNNLNRLYQILIAIEIGVYKIPPTYHKLYLLAKKDENNDLGKLPLEIWCHILSYLSKDYLSIS